MEIRKIQLEYYISISGGKILQASSFELFCLHLIAFQQVNKIEKYRWSLSFSIQINCSAYKLSTKNLTHIFQPSTSISGLYFFLRRLHKSKIKVIKEKSKVERKREEERGSERKY